MDPVEMAKTLLVKGDANQIRDFLSKYGPWLDKLGMGKYVDALGARYDVLVKGGSNQQPAQSVAGAAATGFGQGLMEAWDKLTKLDAPPAVKWIGLALGAIAVTVVGSALLKAAK